MISSIKQSTQIVVGVSSQQIANHRQGCLWSNPQVAGVTIDGRFVMVRGLIEKVRFCRWDDAPAPSTETDKGRFSLLNVIPSNLINNILIFFWLSPLRRFRQILPVHIFRSLPKTGPKTRFQPVIPWPMMSATLFWILNTRTEVGPTDWLGFDNGLHKLPG